MHKLVILVNAGIDPTFDDEWPVFLHLVEQMPGLQREATSRVHHVLFGEANYVLMHELYFDSLEELQQAMASPLGQKAGYLLQKMTRGQMVLFSADHREDELENIRKYRMPEEDDSGADPN